MKLLKGSESSLFADGYHRQCARACEARAHDKKVEINLNKVIPTKNSTWKTAGVPRGKNHNKTATKTTVSLYLSKKIVKKARNHKLNLSRITEQALLSILDYLESEKQYKSSKSLNACSLLRENARAGSPVRLRRRPHAAKIAGSNPARPTQFY